ncbi:glycerophosphoryl diester phosphodiesterase [Nitrincola sp. MINF-07-Sa-05]|uniref:glycerophosphoryl diester phosphodiesterase n=1 Tax=Nitrincola salilacus TaxID=3400273 RepID=UPI003917D32F
MLTSRLIGHRGVASLAPENTLAGIRLAAEMGVKWVELDVTLLGDDTPVLIHDADLERCSSSEGLVIELRRQDLKGIDAGSWFSEEFAGEPLPLLNDALTLINHLGLGLNLEIKTHSVDPDKITRIVQACLTNNPLPADKLLISSFEHDTLQAWYRTEKKTPLGYLVEALPDDWQQRLDMIRARSLNFDWQQVSAKEFMMVKDAGFELYSYTCNDPDQGALLWQQGVDGVITDYPQRFPIS